MALPCHDDEASRLAHRLRRGQRRSSHAEDHTHGAALQLHGRAARDRRPGTDGNKNTPHLPAAAHSAAADPPLLNYAIQFSWKLAAAEGERAVEASCTLAVKAAGAVAAVASAPSNSTQFVPLPAGLTLTSDTVYTYTVTCGASTASSTFSTGLLVASDWTGADWIGGAGSEAVLMRKKITIAGEVTRARIFIAVPGYGQVSVNGVDVDGDAGTRTWSQYDIRTLYHTYDVTDQLKAGENVLGLHIGKGWYGMWGYGNPTAKAVLRYTVGGKTTTVATDSTWTAGASPVLEDSEYNGVTYDARNETKGWDTTACISCSTWAAVTTGKTAAPKLSNTTLSSASFAAVDVMHTFTAKWMRGKNTSNLPQLLISGTFLRDCLRILRAHPGRVCLRLHPEHRRLGQAQDHRHGGHHRDAPPRGGPHAPAVRPARCAFPSIPPSLRPFSDCFGSVFRLISDCFSTDLGLFKL